MLSSRSSCAGEVSPAPPLSESCLCDTFGGWGLRQGVGMIRHSPRTHAAKPSHPVIGTLRVEV